MELLKRAAELEAMCDDAEDRRLLEPELRGIKARVVALAFRWARGVTPTREAEPLRLSDRIRDLVPWL
jgi:hypothetical protein